MKNDDRCMIQTRFTDNVSKQSIHFNKDLYYFKEKKINIVNNYKTITFITSI